MNLHPAVLMVAVWLGAVALFFALPFQLEGTRVMTLYGFLILVLFIGVFCTGALAAARPQPQQRRPDNLMVDFTLTDRALMVAGVIAILASLLDVQGRNLLDLADAYQVRSDRAGALLAGGQSESTIWFQIAFVTYPAGYVYIVREVAYRARPVLWRIAAFGLGPVILTSLAMGGRAPLFYAIIVLVYGFALRKQLFKPQAPRPVRAAAVRGGPPRRRPFQLTGLAKAGIVLLGAVSVLYFIQVFLARADVVGGVDGMFGVASQTWGVNFNGRFSSLFFSLLGADGTYLVFIFVWYLIQGLVMSNAIFSDYEGSMLLGAYGVDLVAALLRRVNGEFIGNGYAELLQMNVYGFLPSAFGSLYVDLHFFGLLPCLIWGWLAGKVYGKVRQGRDPRWLLVVPFITVGIFFSLINSPIGFSNGFVTHIWLIVAFMTARVRTRLPAPRRNPAVATR
jgi:oligosaccharide repeat unit polymerase